jgi:hypothetical protein
LIHTRVPGKGVIRPASTHESVFGVDCGLEGHHFAARVRRAARERIAAKRGRLARPGHVSGAGCTRKLGSLASLGAGLGPIVAIEHCSMLAEVILIAKGEEKRREMKQ